MRLKILKDCTIADDGIMADKDAVILVNPEDAEKLISAKVATGLKPEVEDSENHVEKPRKASKAVRG